MLYARLPFRRSKKQNPVTRPNHRTVKLQTAAAAERSPAAATGAAYMRKLDAVEWIAMDILSRIEKIVQENPAAIVDRLSTKLPRELADSQAYFLQKIAHARKMLNELSGLLQTRSENVELRERMSVELMIFFVLIESYRPERMLESGWNPGEEAREAVQDRIESIGLDVINIRERLK